jgi:hypothetical protein
MQNNNNKYSTKNTLILQITFITIQLTALIIISNI